MKALRWHNRGDVRLEKVDDAPPPGHGQIRIAVEWCGICGTDVEEYRDGPIVIPANPHPMTGYCAPIIIGHEVSGCVLDIGEGVSRLKPGQLVGLDGSLYCGGCAACRRRQLNLCETWAFIGMSYPGGLAEMMTVPAEMAIAAPEGVPSENIALAEPFSVAVRAVRRGRLAVGERVAVLGAGTIGLAILQVALSQGAESVIVVDPIPFRRTKASELGAAQTMEPGDDLVQALREAAGGGPDLIFDCTGSNLTPNQATLAVRPGGRVVQVGLPATSGEFSLLQLALREVELIGVVGHIYNEDYAAAVDLIATGAVNAQALITHRLSLSEAVPKGLELLAGSDASQALKILINPQRNWN